MKRRLLKLGMLLLAGAIINVAVAWGCTLLLRPSWASISSQGWLTWQPNNPPWRVLVRNEIGAASIYACDMRTVGLEVNDAMLKRFRTGEFAARNAALTLQEIPRWSVLHICWESLVKPGPTQVWEYAYGAPLIAIVRYEEDLRPASTSQRIVNSVQFRTHRLPIGIYWPGFAINTLFYAAIVWLLFATPLKLRRWRRIRRGLCPACAYPVGTSDKCTECGKPV